MPLTSELIGMRDQIRTIAREAGLDFYEVVFELLDWEGMNVVAAYGGFPNRYPHWRFGMEYEHLSKSAAYGLHKIYEMVVNNDPTYAYLLGSNTLTDQKMVMAHVYAHSDFFKNNLSFRHTNRKMMDEMGNHRAKIQRMMMRFGVEAVEEVIDRALSLENLIDMYRSPRSPSRRERVPVSWQEGAADVPSSDETKTEIRSERDLLLYLTEEAPLESWQQEILEILREEAYYFSPQAQTKILNEGWATFMHSKIMTEKVLRGGEVIDYAERHAGTVATQGGRINPYKLGLDLLRDVEDRWNKGRFGREYEECTDFHERLRWDRQTGQGLNKLFEVRRLYDDVGFLDAFLTEDFCREHRMYHYAYNPSSGTYEIVDRDFFKIKTKLLQNLTNLGQPVVTVQGRPGDIPEALLLKHVHEGVDLRVDWAWETLKSIYFFWKRPVLIETFLDGIPKRLIFDGREQKEQRLT